MSVPHPYLRLHTRIASIAAARDCTHKHAQAHTSTHTQYDLTRFHLSRVKWSGARALSLTHTNPLAAAATHRSAASQPDENGAISSALKPSTLSTDASTEPKAFVTDGAPYVGASTGCQIDASASSGGGASAAATAAPTAAAHSSAGIRAITTLSRDRAQVCTPFALANPEMWSPVFALANLPIWSTAHLPLLMSSSLVSRDELEAMRRRAAVGHSVVHPADEAEAVRKVALRESSKARAGAWGNTLAAVRSKKEFARADRESAAEVVRVALDAEEEERRAAERLTVLRRANELIMSGTDRMKAVRSQRVMSEVTEVRPRAPPPPRAPSLRPHGVCTCVPTYGGTAGCRCESGRRRSVRGRWPRRRRWTARRSQSSCGRWAGGGAMRCGSL